MRPVVSQSAELLYASLEPGGFTLQDEKLGWPLLKFCEVLVGPGMLEDIAELVRDGANGEPGWSIMMDVDRAPEWALPWLGQFAGVRVPEGLSAAEKRARIVSTDGFRRGSVEAIKGAPLPYLTGTKYVFVAERYRPDDPTADHPYRLYVATRPEETPDAARVLAALLEQKPAGIVLAYTVTSETSSYEGVHVYHANYDALVTKYATYETLSPFKTGNITQAQEQNATYADLTGTYGNPA